MTSRFRPAPRRLWRLPLSRRLVETADNEHEWLVFNSFNGEDVTGDPEAEQEMIDWKAQGL